MLTTAWHICVLHGRVSDDDPVTPVPPFSGSLTTSRCLELWPPSHGSVHSHQWFHSPHLPSHFSTGQSTVSFRAPVQPWPSSKRSCFGSVVVRVRYFWFLPSDGWQSDQCDHWWKWHSGNVFDHGHVSDTHSLVSTVAPEHGRPYGLFDSTILRWRCWRPVQSQSEYPLQAPHLQ